MKNCAYLLFFLTTSLFISCSNTEVIVNKNVIEPSAPPVSGLFKQRVLIEDYTGTWCGNCTRVSYAISQVLENTDKAVPVAIHCDNDPFRFQNIQPLQQLISPGGSLELPQSRINRIITWTFPEDLNIQEPVNYSGNNSGLGIALESSLSGNTVNLNVKAKFANNYSNLRLVVYLLEDHLFYNQANYTSHYNSQNPIVNFEHNHVLRTSLTNLLGDAVTENTSFGQTYTRNFSFTVPSNVANSSNISFVAFIVGPDNKVLNVRGAHINENQVFEQNP